MIQRQNYTIKSLLITNELLTIYINRFWSDIFSKIKNNKHLMLMCKVQYLNSDLGYRTLGDLRSVNFDDKELFTNYLVQRLGLLNEEYTTYPVTKISFSFFIKSGLATESKNNLMSPEIKTSTVHNFNNLSLPITMLPSEYGDIISQSVHIVNDVKINRFIIVNGGRTYQIDSSLDKLVNKVKILDSTGTTWTDTSISEDVIRRDIGKSAIYFMAGVKILRKRVLPSKAFSRLTPDTNLATDFITMDIETVDILSKKTPYLICGYNGSDYITSYAKLVNGDIDQKSLFNSFINQLLTFISKNGNTLHVYAHNLSSFDGIFLLNHLIQFGKVDPLIHNGKIMSIKLKLNIQGYIGKTIIFKDSYLLLPMALRYLCLAFDIDLAKGYFPFKLTNIFYTGVIPTIEKWTGMDLDTYNNIVKDNVGKTWNFKEEATKYCKLDCKCLHQLLVKFSKLIFDHFSININKVLTLPALAMRIYKTHFMPEDSIYQITGAVDSDIRQAYTGGAVDVYIPTNRRNIISLIHKKTRALFTKLFLYDVNSLYPFVMSKAHMPIGKPVAFEGDIRKVDLKAFGFFYCKITSPNYIRYPVLQRKIQTSEGLRTIAGLGSWTGWIFSGEMDNAANNFSYEFEIIRGYQFDKGDIFSAYVNKMYSLRMDYPKGHPMNLIAKLLMNSLYGKFGMKQERTITEIFNLSNDSEKELFSQMLDNFGSSVIDFVEIDNHVVTIRKNLLNFTNSSEDNDLYHSLDVNVAIASAITAGGRMWMSAIRKLGILIYYSDTDSYVTNKPLPKELIGDNLGQFKLEHTIKKAVFLAPKVYALINNQGEEIIKVKGLTKDTLPEINFETLENLLIKDSSLEFTQEKWFKKVIAGEIEVDQVA